MMFIKFVKSTFPYQKRFYHFKTGITGKYQHFQYVLENSAAIYVVSTFLALIIYLTSKTENFHKTFEKSIKNKIIYNIRSDLYIYYR